VAQVTDEEKKILVEWNITVSSSLDKSVHKIITTENTDFRNNLSGFVEQAIRIYFLKFNIALIAKTFSNMDKSEKEEFFSLLKDIYDSEGKK
jgi:hypothetical protein